MENGPELSPSSHFYHHYVCTSQAEVGWWEQPCLSLKKKRRKHHVNMQRKPVVDDHMSMP